MQVSTVFQNISKSTVKAALANHIGEANGIHARALAQALVGSNPGPAAERRLRQVIAELRMDGQQICGTPEAGYFLATHAAELDKTCAFLYDRAMASLQQVARMKRVSLPDLRGQLQLPI
jgi:hypothetical protein